MIFTQGKSEKRTHERVTLRTQAIILLPDRKTIKVRTLDIALGGMAIVADGNPNPGVTFNIQLTIPLRADILPLFEAKVRVAHSVLSGREGGFKIGLQFIELSDAAESVLKQFLEQNSK
ncbi:MAG: PilZ domain-containing protein [Nitrosomonas sp.]|nr:PilZ domain-containing protein [Nitrosomonas sp.]MBK7363885.1 PilZ domain-containing protein [Nitrosomonas sp.]